MEADRDQRSGSRALCRLTPSARSLSETFAEYARNSKPPLRRQREGVPQTDVHEAKGAVRVWVGTRCACIIVEGDGWARRTLKGMLCTMHHLVILDNSEQAIAYNFDDMVRYVMYSYVHGRHDVRQTAIVCGQIERNARFISDEYLLSPCTPKCLEKAWKGIMGTAVYRAIESATVCHPDEQNFDEEIGSNPELVMKYMQDYIGEHTNGNWTVLIPLSSDQAELAFDAVVQCIAAGRPERTRIWKVLLQEAQRLHNPPVENNTDEASDDVNPLSSDSASTEVSSAASSSDIDAKTSANSSMSDSEPEVLISLLQADKSSKS